MKVTATLAHTLGEADHLADTAFTILLANPETQTTITAQAPTLDNALGFICDCCDCETLLPSHWQMRDNHWVMKVFDWEECGAPQFPPAIARIIAPAGFVPPALPVGSLV